MLLYELLNNTVTPSGHRVIVYLDAKRLVKGKDWEEGFSTGLLNSLVALPLVSEGVLRPMTKLRGDDSDQADNVAKEFLIMQAIQGRAGHTLQTIYPILVGRPHTIDEPGYPGTSNFFQQCGHLIPQIVDLPSPPTTNAVVTFLKDRLPGEDPSFISGVTLRGSINSLCARQGAQLWGDLGGLPEEEMHENAALCRRVEV